MATTIKTGSKTTISSTYDPKTAAADALKTVETFDKYLQSRRDADLAKYAPELQQLMGTEGASLRQYMSSVLPELIAGEQASYRTLRGVGSQYMTGQLPADVAAAVRRGSAQAAVSGGMGGQLGSNIVARDLGLQSIQLQQLGAQFLGQATNTTTNLANISKSAQDRLQAYTGTALAIANAGRVDSSTLGALTSAFGNLGLQYTQESNDLEIARLQDLTERAKIQEDYQKQLNDLRYAQAMSNRNLAAGALGTQAEQITGLYALQPGGPSQMQISKFNTDFAQFTQRIMNQTTPFGSGATINRLWA